MEHHINPLLRGNGPAIHCDGGAFGHLVLRSLGPGAPYLDPARLDQRLGLFARDHWPVAANSLSNRSMVSPLLYPLFSPLYHIFSAVDIE